VDDALDERAARATHVFERIDDTGNHHEPISDAVR
jgi:hypothetical protein